MRKSSSHLLSLGLLAAMLLSFFPVGIATASAPVPPSPAEVLPSWWANEPAQQDTTAEIEPLLLETLAVEGTADFFIWMEEKADLSPAYELETKEEKGQFVYETLVATAERTQADLRAYLDRQGVDYRPFYIANKILVRGGDLALVTAVAERPEVGRITANHQFQLQEPFRTPDVVEHTLAVESNISFVNADDVWALGVTGANTVLAGNDTGLDWDHPALIEQYRGWDGSTADHNYNWWDATSTYPTVPGDGHGHGTHTSGTMVGDDGAGNQIGMAPAAELLHCKNMTDSGSGSDATFTECFEWDLAPWDLSYTGPGTGNPRPDLAPDAVNNSWGYWGGNAPQFEDEIAALQAAGILIEVSAGNEGSSCATLRSPSDYEQVLTTGSVQHTGGILPGTITGFSSRGPSDLYPDSYMPDVMAPGENIRSSIPGGSFQDGWSGTSMSGPHVTGLIALMWSASPALRGQVTPTVQIIIDTAVPLTGQSGSNCGGDYTDGPNNDWGYGTIDALAAVQMAIALGAGGAIEGTVTDSSTTDPIEDVQITAVHDEGYSWNASTDATGYYTMTVASGTYTVTAEHPQYETAMVTGVTVVTDAVVTQDFSLTPRGRLFGYVTDYDNGFPLDATVVVSGVGFVETNPATGYYEMYLDAGSYDLTAIADDYVAETATVSISSGGDTQQDFALMAEVTFIPAPVEVTVGWGNTHSEPMTITNRMTDTYAFEFLELPGGFVPTLLGESEVLAAWPGPDGFGYTGEDVTYQWVDIAATGTSVALSDDDYDGPFSIGFTFNLYGTDYTDFYISSNGHIDFGAGSTDLGNDCPLPHSNAPNNIIAPMWDDLNPNSTGALVYYESFSACPVGPGSCLVVQYENFYHYGGAHAGTFEAIMFDNGSVLMQFEDTGDETGSGSTTAIEGNNTAGDHGLTYACNVAGSLVDSTAVCFVYPGSSGCEAAEIPWVGQNPVSGTVPGQTSLNGWLNFTATESVGIDQPGDYYMTLLVNGDPQLRVPVTMTVSPAATQGKLEGTVTSMGYCDANPFPLEDAEVFIEGAGGYTYTLWTDASGHYQRWLDAGTYSVTVSYPEHPTTTMSLAVTGGMTTTQDFSLRWQQPCVDVVPDSLSTVVDMGMSDTLPINIYNDGAIPMDFELVEQDRGFDPAVVSIPRFEGELAPDTAPPSTDRAPNAPTLGEVGASDTMFELLGAMAYAVDIYPGYDLVNFDSDTPGTWTIVADLPGNQYFGGDFLGGDFGTLYALDYGLNELHAIDTATGAVTVIGTATPNSGENWTGMTGATDGTLYASSSACGTNSTLYTVDPATGATTIIGQMRSGSCMIDIAINANGEMYGVDIVDDNLYSIDTNTGVATLVGSLGVGANYAQGMDFEEESGVLYWAAYTSSGELRIIDTATGASTLVGGFPGGAETDSLAFATGGAADVPWLFESPITGTVAPDGGSAAVDVTMDSAYVDQPGEYYAWLRVKSNDPVNDNYAVPVTMTVNAPANWGKMDGWIYSMGYCDVATPTLMAETTMYVENSSGMTWTLEGSESGYYIHWFEAGTYTVTVMAPDHMTETDTVQVTGGVTTTHDFELRWMYPCASVQPDGIEMTIRLGDQDSTSLVVVNDGAEDMDFVMAEISTTAPSLFHLGVAPGALPPVTPRERLAGYDPNAMTTEGHLAPAAEPAYHSGILAAGDVLDDWPTGLTLPWGTGFSGDDEAVWFGNPGAGGGDDLNHEYDVSGTPTGRTVNPSTGASWYGDIAYNPNTGMFWQVNVGGDNCIFEWDPNTGVTGNSICGSDWTGTSQRGLAYDPATDTYFVGGWNSNVVYHIDNTGAVIEQWSHNSISGLAYNFVEGLLFIQENSTSDTISVLDVETGTIVDSFTVAGFGSYVGAGLAIDCDGNLWAANQGNGSAYLVDSGVPSGLCADTDIPWLSQDPITGTVPADSVRSADIIFTAFPTLTEWATYPVFTGTLVVKTDDQYAGDSGKMYIPVTMTVSAAPLCSFETNSPVEVGDTVYFTNTTLGDAPLSYEWAFGDGTGSTMVSPTHVYDDSGMYTAWLTATNPLGTDVCSGTIQVSGPPNASFISNSPIELGEVAYFTDTSTGYPPVAIWFWNFGSSATPSTSAQQNPGPVMFSAVGTYTVTLTVNNGYTDDPIDTYSAQFVVVEATENLYLPVVLKNF